MLPRMTITVRPAAVARCLAIVVALLTLATYVAQVMKWREIGTGLARFIDSDQKVNLPTAYKMLALVAACLLVWTIARRERAANDRFATQWLVLTCAIAFLALDESVYLHQSLGNYLRDHAGASGVLHYAWVAVYVPAGLAVMVYVAPLFRNLARATRRSLLGATLLFGGGAAVSALVKGEVVSDSGHESLSFYLVAATSDVVEMVGLAILVVVLVREVAARVGDIRIELT